MSEAIGIDIGGTNIRAARISASGEIIARIIQPTAKTAPAVLAQIDALIEHISTNSCKSIGIGVPGRVNSLTGEALSGGFVDLSGAPLASRLRTSHIDRFYIDNDASMALFAEAKLGAAKGHAHVVMLTIGTGIGGALMLDGKIVHGRMNAGQLGHITIDINGPQCLCGRKGCLETFSSGTAFGRLLEQHCLKAGLNLETISQSSEPVARKVLADWILPLRCGIDSLVASFDPDLVVLGGGLGIAAAAALDQFPALSPWYQYKVSAARLGDDAGVIGAALAALEMGR